MLKHHPTLPFPLFLGLVLFQPASGQDSSSGNGIHSRIFLGQETSEFESVGIIGTFDLGGFCTGTLISPSHVLTAAHCVESDANIDPTSNGAASSDSLYFEVDGKQIEVADVLLHPDFRVSTLANDIAILILSEPVLGVAPSLILRQPPQVGDVLEIVGFGVGGDGVSIDPSEQDFGVKRVGMTMIEEVGDTIVGWTFDEGGESNSSRGDSGGPGFLPIGEDSLIATITSGGTQSDGLLGDMAFNTRVDAYADWIDIAVAADPATQTPPNDQPDSDQPDSDAEADTMTCADRLSGPFPFLRLLIDFLTAVLEALDNSAAIVPPEATSPEATSPDSTSPSFAEPATPITGEPASQEPETDEPATSPEPPALSQPALDFPSSIDSIQIPSGIDLPSVPLPTVDPNFVPPTDVGNFQRP